MSDRASVQDTVTPTSTIVEEGGNHPTQLHSAAKEATMDEDTESVHGQVALTCLLVNGERQTFYFAPDTSIHQVKDYIHTHWPKGRFLDDQNTLAENKITPTRPFTVHLTIRPRAPSVPGKLIVD
ncbi:hypothetical protein BDF19DRAFT_422128 [Syncephalis fuscata]|nr:hypothetical protein BDF19DRAFT_422128 [Syncephalis fuscata]